jgi:hypothetical protein
MGEHEDQLTRAYLVLLKHSSRVFFTFVEYCRNRHKTSGNEEPIPIIDFLEQDWEIETQRGNPEINTKYLLSILITDSQIKTAGSSVQTSKRNARYDGIITFGSKLTMVIENKPRSGDVWLDQMNPTEQNLADGITIYPKPTVLEWKEIIKQLNHLLTIPNISGCEKIMIEDFLSYIDEKFNFLNPYDRFHQCKRDKELLNRRIENLLKSISKPIPSDENIVKCHHGPLSYYIQTPYREIERICLGLSGEGNESSITLFLEGRNIFIHNLYRQEWFDTNTEEGRDAIWNFLETYQRCLWEVYHIANAAIFKHNEIIGMPETEYDKKIKETGYLDLIKSYYSRADFAFKSRKL